ncbi:MAG: carbamoyl phosphate synthase small subunit [Bacillota bacterium]|nr:carbamoyl phosphate synthase small subunit [Bacillota bacterium]
MSKTAYLLLQNGIVFKGKSFGAEAETIGELVFTTAMTGYLETLTDPSYYGQIVVQTFPLIGNYGVIPSDFESHSPAMKAYIVRDWCQEPSNFRSEGDLDTFLKQNKIPGLYGIDTRALTRIVREYGVMNATITYSDEKIEEKLKAIQKYTVKDAVKSVSRKETKIFKAENPEHNVVLWDFGAKNGIQNCLLKRNCNVTIVPSTISANEILTLKPDGVMLSNGPGDPAENVLLIEQIKKLAGAKIPMFGICLGHQLLALSQGAKTEKLKYGHRGANQPASETETGRVYITSQNHGYAVVKESLPSNAKASFTNANDGTVEGIKYTNMPAFSVQFHPEACGGPLDTGFLFDKFIDMMN